MCRRHRELVGLQLRVGGRWRQQAWHRWQPGGLAPRGQGPPAEGASEEARGDGPEARGDLRGTDGPAQRQPGAAAGDNPRDRPQAVVRRRGDGRHVQRRLWPRREVQRDKLSHSGLEARLRASVAVRLRVGHPHGAEPEGIRQLRHLLAAVADGLRPPQLGRVGRLAGAQQGIVIRQPSVPTLLGRVGGVRAERRAAARSPAPVWGRPSPAPGAAAGRSAQVEVAPRPRLCLCLAVAGADRPVSARDEHAEKALNAQRRGAQATWPLPTVERCWSATRRCARRKAGPSLTPCGAM
mmetsp:Transcript_93804/g.251659  ORF Transcript_93804/g.251659 Transcript_93804/m.251659 type:complete len:295 (-) Transcript_93804:156-1040(-)